ncbi:MAG TPA: hypothetical protein VFX65_01550 [Candidatus Limnocylindrales bacterium]|nr:hypothetical protein [Candidatus Limnocylindrales bacterium]
MAIVRGGRAGSGLDRALDHAQRAELDDILESGELYPGERDEFPEPYGPYDPAARPWQMPFAVPRTPPASAESLPDALRGRGDPSPAQAVRAADGDPASRAAPAAAAPAAPAACPATNAERAPAYREKLGERRAAKDADSDVARARFDFRFRDELTGVVLIHGVGRQLAGSTLLDWTRPIITLLGDAARFDADRPPAERRLKPLADGPRPVDDPVFRSSIDFSGETFPVVQLRVPGRTDVPDTDPRADERRWLVTETWWAARVTPPTLQAMIGWIGEEGGLSRILQGVQEHMLGHGILGHAARWSLQAVVSVVVAFAMLVFAVLLGVTRLLPIGPLRDFVALQAASSWLTGNFGGARTLLRDPAQSANVRGRLVATIKALRAYGCRHIVIVGHSGGTMVSLQTLTDPAHPRLRVDKLITHGEALNLAWRIENEDQDAERPKLPRGHRMAGDMATAQPRLVWRDFWATHDPASSGPPVLPEGMTDPGAPRFLAERVYNRMRISEDHNVFWDNDEHYLIPLIREIDAVTTDRSNSAFYSDAAESAVRARRKERVALLGLWRRATLALPVMAILAALLVNAGGALGDAARLALGAFESVPFHAELTAAGRSLHALGDAKIAGWLPDALTWQRWYDLGSFVLQLAFLVALVLAVVPGRPDRLWLGRPRARAVLLAFDVAIGAGALAVIAVWWLLTVLPEGQIGDLLGLVLGSGLPGLVVVAGGLIGIGWLGRRVRAAIRRLEGSQGYPDRFLRDAVIVASAIFLAAVLLVLIAAIVGVVLVFAGNAAVPRSDEIRELVLGSIVVLVAFQLIQRLGIWRWDAWDVRERRALRRRPLDAPFRGWAYFLAAALVGIAVLGALIVALAGPSGWIAALGGLVLLVVVLSVGKDVVDNDVDTGEPSVVVPEVKGPAAGESAS